MIVDIHPRLGIEFADKCKDLNVKNPNHMVAALMRGFLSECSMTNNPEILRDSSLVERKNNK